jgi:hypothetical protein
VAKEWTVRILVGTIGIGRSLIIGVVDLIAGFTDRQPSKVYLLPKEWVKSVYTEVKDLSKL